MATITPCLWFDGNAEEAVRFYCSLLPDSRVDAVHAAPNDYPAGKQGDVLLVEFTLMGRPFTALNGGPYFKFNEAVSLQVMCADQGEVDRYWAALSEGGEPGPCGWLKDRFGLSWQVVPQALGEWMACGDVTARERGFQALMGMRKLDVAALRAAFGPR